MRHIIESIGLMLIVFWTMGALGLIDFNVCIGAVGECVQH